MNIQYRGASEYTNNLRLAEIQYKPDEEDMVDRFVMLLEIYDMRKTYSEYESVTIEVEDKEDYNYVKDLYKAYKEFDTSKYIKEHNLSRAIDKWHQNLYTDDGLYDACKTDLDLYIILMDEGFNEWDIMAFMKAVSYSSDAYNEATSRFLDLLM